MVWNTTFHITFNGDEALADSILTVLSEVNESLSFFNENSLLTKLNAAPDSLAVDRHIIRVYDTARTINRLSNGLYDPTVSPLIDAWGFGKGHAVSADTARIDSLLLSVGMNKTDRHGSYIVKRHPDISFNFSSIAKGYGCDAVAEMLRRNGVTDYLVEIGGEIAVAGKNPSGGDWTVSIDRPLQSAAPQHQSQLIINISRGGVATSGNYRNFHKSGDSTFGHTISPITGRPVDSDVISATVIAPTAMEADALATACMAAGKAESQRMSRESGFDIMLILNDSTVWTSPGFDKRIAH